MSPDVIAPARVAGLATWRISRLHARAHRLLADRLAAEGYRGLHYRLLAALAESGEASQIALGQRTGLDRSDVTVAIDQLAGLGLVVRSPDPADRRRNIITLTPEGVAQLAALDRIVSGVQDELLAPLPAHDRAQFDRLLDALLETGNATD